MNKGSILKRFLYFLLAFLILIIDQVPTIYLGVKDIRLVCLLIFVLLLMSAGALFLGKRLGLFEGFKALSSLKAWGMIGLTYLGSHRKCPYESLPSHNVYSNYGTNCGRAGFSRAPHGTRL